MLKKLRSLQHKKFQRLFTKQTVFQFKKITIECLCILGFLSFFLLGHAEGNPKTSNEKFFNPFSLLTKPHKTSSSFEFPLYFERRMFTEWWLTKRFSHAFIDKYIENMLIQSCKVD